MVLTPGSTLPGLGSSHFARRYFGNRFFFLFLRLLRCFSSPGSPPCVMDSRMDDRGLLCRVSPFRHLRIKGYLHLPAAFRSLLRLSSALSAKASTLRSCSLTINVQDLLFLYRACSVTPHGLFRSLTRSGVLQHSHAARLSLVLVVSSVFQLQIPLGCLFIVLDILYVVFKVQIYINTEDP